MLNKNPDMGFLRKVRSHHHSQLMKLPYVMGTALGMKFTNNQCSGEKCVVVLVKEKRNLINKYELIPKTLNFGNVKLITDVVEVSQLKSQFGNKPYFCFDELTLGTVSATFHSFGHHYCVTCAHCLTGLDLDPYQTSKMKLYHAGLNKYVSVGHSTYAVISPGRGISSNFGFSDAGLFSIEDSELLYESQNGTIADVWNYPQLNAHVYSTTARGEISGFISHLEVVFGSVFVDMIIKVDDVGMYGGDSGSLWKTSNNLIVSMHAKGQGDGSLYSFCMSARRIVNELQGNFII